MARLFCRLKLRLLRNGLRQSRGRAVALLFVALVAAGLAGAGLLALASLRGERLLAGDVGVVLFTGLALGWTVLPVLAFGVDETLDPARLALLPLTRRELMTGLVAASAVGIPAAATAVALTGSVVGLTGGPLSVLVGVVAAGLELMLCLALSRAVTSALSRVLRSRRGRDASILVGAGVAVSLQLLNVLSQRLVGSADRQVLHAVATPLRWTPPGLAASATVAARDGQYGVALADLVAVTITVLLLLTWWQRTLGRALVTADASTTARPSSRERLLTGRWGGLLSSRVGAVATKELRYAWREPRRKAGWAGALLLGAILPLAAALSGQGLHRGAVFVIGTVALFAGLQSFNQFGLDGGAVWLHVTTVTEPTDLLADLAGKNLAVAVIAVPAMVVVGSALAALTGGWALLPAALAVGADVLGVALGVGNVVSVRAPYAVPERTTAFAATNPGQGCLVGLSAMVGMLAVLGLALPPLILWIGARLVVPSSAAGVLLLLGAGGYGAAVCWGGRRLAAGTLSGRLPEILAAVSPRRAA